MTEGTWSMTYVVSTQRDTTTDILVLYELCSVDSGDLMMPDDKCL